MTIRTIWRALRTEALARIGQADSCRRSIAVRVGVPGRRARSPESFEGWERCPPGQTAAGRPRTRCVSPSVGAREPARELARGGAGRQGLLPGGGRDAAGPPPAPGRRHLINRRGRRGRGGLIGWATPCRGPRRRAGLLTTSKRSTTPATTCAHAVGHLLRRGPLRGRAAVAGRVRRAAAYADLSRADPRGWRSSSRRIHPGPGKVYRRDVATRRTCLISSRR